MKRNPTLFSSFAIVAYAAVSLVLCFQMAASARKATASPRQSRAQLPNFKPGDSVTRDGFQHFYNMEYDAAIRDFEQALAAHPNDPFVINHLLEAVLVREMNHQGVLDFELYLSDEFLHTKKVPVDPKTRAQISDLTRRALELSDERLKTNSRDVDALYSRGVTHGLHATYVALVDKAWFEALRNSFAGYKDHKHALTLEPNYHDAKLVVGVYNYVLGSLPWAAKAAAALVTIHGSKSKAFEYMGEAAGAGGEASIDAQTSLAVLLGREKDYQKAIPLARRLYADYPRNFLYGLMEANLLKASGQLPEAIEAYQKLIDLGRKGKFSEARLGKVAYALGETYRQQQNYSAAAQAYESVSTYPNSDREPVAKAELAAGQMYDLMQQRDRAIKKYETVAAGGDDSSEAKTARRLLKHPYKAPS